MIMDSQPAHKKRKTTRDQGHVNEYDYSESRSMNTTMLTNTTVTNPAYASSSLGRSISPPAVRRRDEASSSSSATHDTIVARHAVPRHISNLIPSPVQLSRVDGLPSASNIDTVSLRDILGDPLISECWVFNYLFDIEFLMSNFDEDVRDLVRVNVIHGSWKSEDSNKIRIDEAVKQYPNVRAITAYMAEMFGTHHSKMLILFRHDDQAQVNILTANMVAGDWRMCQAVWRSPLLPLFKDFPLEPNRSEKVSGLGGGETFKRDLLAYLRTYGQAKLGDLISQLKSYDFNSIRAALVASTPGKQYLQSVYPETETLWGWPGLKSILSNIPIQASPARSHVVVQVSSVASLGAGNKWMDETLLTTLATGRSPQRKGVPRPRFSLVFPTADEVRKSLDGYGSGGSIHMKTQSTSQASQLAHLRPMLCHWAGDVPQSIVSCSPSTAQDTVREAGRRRAAPHIKTYIRFVDETMRHIDWAMMTSANLSTQAWGAATNAGGEVRICSYEIGVVVWPALWDDGMEGRAEMVPSFKKDKPDGEIISVDGLADTSNNTLIGWRMPYDLPLVPYARDEMPWCATAPDEEPDWMGRSWPGFGSR